MALCGKRLLALALGTALAGGYVAMASADEGSALQVPFFSTAQSQAIGQPDASGQPDVLGKSDSDGQPGFSVGSIGLDSQAGTSRWAQATPDPYRFVIPADQSARKAPGFLVKIPFGSP